MKHRLTQKFLGYLNSKSLHRQLRLRVDQSSIYIEGPKKEIAVVSWNRITRIVAFKRDTYGSDLMCLLVEQDSGTILEVNEEIPGWADLINEIPRQLPTAKPYAVWFLEVA